MSNIKICGFGIAQEGVEAAMEMLKVVEGCLVGLDECWVTVVPSFSKRVGAEEAPYLEIVYERRDLESGQVKQVVKRLKKAKIGLIIEFHLLALAQLSPDLNGLKDLFGDS